MRAERITVTAAATGANTVVDRIDHDTIALAERLTQLGATVTLLATWVDHDVTDDDVERLCKAGVRVARDGYAEIVDRCDLLFAHDYTAPSAPVIEGARRAGCRIAHLADLLFEQSPALTVGVTGSAGKSTTAAMIGAVLRAAGRRVHIPGRHKLMGSSNPNWELLRDLDLMTADDVLVVELTSSHLEYMNVSPNVAVVTTISPDHIEWHGSVEAYVGAKRRIVERQTPIDAAVLNYDEPAVREWSSSTSGEVMFYSGAGYPAAEVRLRDGAIVAGPDESVVVPSGGLPLTDGYVVNALAAATAALAVGAPADAVHVGVTGFEGLPGRRAHVACVSGISVVDDALALTPRKATASLSSFADDSVLLVCGGEDLLDGWSVAPMHSTAVEREMIDELAQVAVHKARRVFAIGVGGSRLRTALIHAGVEPSKISDEASLESATRRAVSAARPGDTVLLAPVFDLGDAAARFGQIAGQALGER